MDYRFQSWITLFLLVAVLAGCAKDQAAAPKTQATGTDAHGHKHERDNMLIADAGKYHALLTAHLSMKDGNEIDIFFETPVAKPSPVAIPLASFTAEVRLPDGSFQKAEFAPAPPDERPKDEAPGTCSHFVAKVPWLKADDAYLVVVKIDLDGKPATIRWKDFVPKKYAHHID